MAEIDDPEYVSELMSDPERLREETDEEARYGEVKTGGHVDWKSEIDLNPVAIGLGLENIEYEPRVFAALVYRHDRPEAVVIISSDCQFTAFGSSAEDVSKAIIDTCERIRELGLSEEDAPNKEEITVSKVEESP